MSTPTLQRKFLQEFYEYKSPVSVFLMSGLQLRGVITNFNEEVIFLNDKQMIYTHAISTIQPEGKK